MNWLTRHGWQVRCQVLGVTMMVVALAWMAILLALGA